MSLPDWSPRGTSDWVALAGALVFVMAGAALIARPETTMLRMVALGWPPWTGWLPGLGYLVLGLLLLAREARAVAAVLLLAASVAELAAHVSYRDTGELADAGFRLFLAVLVLWLSRGRRDAPPA